MELEEGEEEEETICTNTRTGTEEIQQITEMVTWEKIEAQIDDRMI